MALHGLAGVVIPGVDTQQDSVEPQTLNPKP